MANYVQIYCSRYDSKARPVAFVFSDGSEVVWDMEDDRLRDWTRPLLARLESLPEGESLYTFNADFEIKRIAPLLTARTVDALRQSKDLYHLMKRHTRLHPYPSYRMRDLAKMCGYDADVNVGGDFIEIFSSSNRAKIEKTLHRNIEAMVSIKAMADDLLARQRGEHVALESFHPSPFQIEGTTDGTGDRYIQYQDILYRESQGRFIFEANARWLPYDATRRALVLESDAPVISRVESPDGFIVFGLDDIIYYETIVDAVEYIRDLSS
ncbi:MAG: hypothetical protein SPI65_04890 [Peptoniphilus sp.]|nr:hypothetical protein [Peptoniphilus sp.]MDD7362706.1 hypothetical protein [Bacillota bacterium]MDY6044895.1 hypothetical protein [Peptoniphilus sp.]